MINPNPSPIFIVCANRAWWRRDQKERKPKVSIPPKKDVLTFFTKPVYIYVYIQMKSSKTPFNTIKSYILFCKNKIPKISTGLPLFKITKL